MLSSKLNAIREQRDAEDRGFTLIELLVVVVIIGILIAIAIPLYLNYQKGAHDKSAASDEHNSIAALNQCYSENANAYPPAASVVTAGNVVTLTCGLTGATTTETINLSSDTVWLYTPQGTADSNGNYQSYKSSAYNSAGHSDSNAVDSAGAKTGHTTYSYDSTAGGIVGP